MPKKIRQIISQLSGQVMNRMRPTRRSLKAPINLSFEPENNTGRLTAKREIFSLKGETNDLSANGIAFIVDSIRLKEYYLVGEGRILNAELHLPNGKVRMEIIGQRYEQIGQHLSVNKYLIGASIKSISPADEEIYRECLRKGNKARKNDDGVLGIEVTET